MGKRVVVVGALRNEPSLAEGEVSEVEGRKKEDVLELADLRKDFILDFVEGMMNRWPEEDWVLRGRVLHFFYLILSD